MVFKIFKNLEDNATLELLKQAMFSPSNAPCGIYRSTLDNPPPDGIAIVSYESYEKVAVSKLILNYIKVKSTEYGVVLYLDPAVYFLNFNKLSPVIDDVRAASDENQSNYGWVVLLKSCWANSIPIALFASDSKGMFFKVYLKGVREKKVYMG